MFQLHNNIIYKNGTELEKKQIQENLKLLSTTRLKKDSKSKKEINVKDEVAEKLYKELVPQNDDAKGAANGLSQKKS